MALEIEIVAKGRGEESKGNLMERPFKFAIRRSQRDAKLLPSWRAYIPGQRGCDFQV